MARGAIAERVDYEMTRIVDNILDLNTKATAKRKVTLTVEIEPDEMRQLLAVKVVAKSALAPTNPVQTSLFVTADENGEMAVVEMTPQAPGQLMFDGIEQEQPVQLNLVRTA